MSVKAWNDEQEAELIKLYNEKGQKDVHELANHFSKGYRSVISKLVQLKIYENLLLKMKINHLQLRLCFVN
jgi:pantothenate kinase-related protein Tda10